MTQKHTPAQWHCNFTHTNNKRVLSEITKDGSTRAIAEFLGDKDAQDVLENARLIAAAPELLAALKQARAAIQEAALDCDSWREVLTAMDAAIAKAEGV